jgi:hypothetical protein
MKYIDQLHDNLVARSLDVKSAAQSITDFNSDDSKVEGVPNFISKLAPWLEARNVELGYEAEAPIDTNDLIKSRQALLIEAIKTVSHMADFAFVSFLKMSAAASVRKPR